jgi:predicted glycosyltransferase
MRLVSWQANHDVGERGISAPLLRHLIQRIAAQGQVIISAEAALPDDLERYRYRGAYEHIHHVIAFCDGYFGESATMASEACVLGIPAVYAALTGRGYTDEQEQRYGLVRNVRQLNQTTFDEALDWLFAQDRASNERRRAHLLADTCDVTAFMVETIEQIGTRAAGA